MIRSSCKTLILFLVAVLSMQSRIYSQDSSKYNIIPKPIKLEARAGEFQLNAKTRIIINGKVQDVKLATDFLVDLVHNATGFKLQYGGKDGNNSIVFSPDQTINNEEGYKLDVSATQIKVRYKTARGAFLAIQSIRQLMPPDIEVKNKGVANFRIPAVLIEDAPRFAYRGVMLDVARHFQPVSFVKRFIDLLAFYKINTFHFHLTEDQGWRIEIKKYPKLQEVSAWRNETLIGHKRDTPTVYDGKPHGGYYTQKELKDLVEYARKRFVTIIPEIEMPGHSLAALAAYPYLGCKDSTYKVSGSWGVFKDIYCPSEATFNFLQDVLTEVMEIFPGKYIHIGGDEAPKDRWKESKLAQDMIRQHNLKDEHGLQSYFISRIEKFLNSKGRAIIGWDEILEGGLAPNATVMSWRGEKGGIAAAKQKHDVVMTPNTFLYLDYYQTSLGRKAEPLAIGGFLPLEKVYSYNPVPASFTAEEAKYIKGVQANIWTEYIPTADHVEHMGFPRICALAEVAWTPLDKKNYQDFLKRLNNNLIHLDKKNVKYSNYFRQTTAL